MLEVTISDHSPAFAGCAFRVEFCALLLLLQLAAGYSLMSYQTIQAQIGNTPLVQLQRLPGDTSNTILAKLEGNNPAGSVKDRPALSMIRQAELRGEIKPGDVLIEATSGNTGIALAMVAAVMGYRMILIDDSLRSRAH